MKLKEKINADFMSAMREKNVVVKNLLSVIKGEIQTIEKNTKVEALSDEEIVKILNKSVKSIKETADENMSIELGVLESYLPKMLSREEITDKIKQLKESGVDNIGGIMKEFSNLPVDRKLVSDIFKEV